MRTYAADKTAAGDRITKAREWLLSARQGLVPANSRVVQFSGDVVLRPADAQPTAFLRADALAIDTQTNIAYSTASPVQVASKGIIFPSPLTASGQNGGGSSG